MIDHDTDMETPVSIACVGTQKSRLNEMVLLRTQNLC